jgi:hypothetical protein
MAKAVHITGDAEMAHSGKQITIGAGPWKGKYTLDQAVALVTSRYLLFARDGALGTTRKLRRYDHLERSAQRATVEGQRRPRVREDRAQVYARLGFLESADRLANLTAAPRAANRPAARVQTALVGSDGSDFN